MRTLLSAFLVASVGLTLQAQPANDTINNPIHFVFLNTGSARAKTKDMSKEELEKMQAAHVGNFGTQFDSGKIFAAGPLGDNGFIRGIVIPNAETAEQVKEIFKPDPFVQNGILDVEAHPWLVDISRFGSPKIPFQLARHTLCIVKKGKNWTPPAGAPKRDAMLQLFPGLEGMSHSGALAIGGPFLDAAEKLGVLMFYSSNTTEIEATMAKEPAVTKGTVALEFHPQFLGAGTFHQPGVDYAPPPPGKQNPLFDGQSFAGWEGDTGRTWRIDNGALVGGSLAATVPRNDFICTTNQFKNFDLRMQVKLAGTGFVNGGIQFRSQRLPEPANEMIGYQADMGEGYWGSLYDESRRKKTLAHTHAALIPGIVRANDWNDYVVRAEDRHIRLWLNGVLTVDYTEPDETVPLTGFIGLQIHGGGKAEASYRNMLMEELP